MQITLDTTNYCSHWLQIAFLWPLKYCGLWPQQIMMDTDCKYPLCDISSVLGFSHNIWDVRERLFILWLEADSVLSGCWTKGMISIVSTKWLLDHLLLYMVNRFYSFSNVVALGHKKLYWSAFTNSLSVSLQMLWPSAMTVDDTIYLLLPKHHGDTCNKLRKRKKIRKLLSIMPWWF